MKKFFINIIALTIASVWMISIAGFAYADEWVGNSELIARGMKRIEKTNLVWSERLKLGR